MTPEILLGPPGTGKTEALLRILEDEMAVGTPPEAIGLVTFTRRAAKEALTRAAEKFGFSPNRFPFFRTLHSLAFHQLGLTAGDVMGARQWGEWSDWAGVRLTNSWEEGSRGVSLGARALHMDNLARVRCRSLEEEYDTDNDNLPWSEVKRISSWLDHYKHKRHLLDYTDMLSHWVAGSQRPPIEVLLVDETQDNSELQWRMISRLAKGCRRVVVAGDDDQTIFRWAGAAVERLIGLPGQVSVLGQSWRVPKRIQLMAEEIVSHLHARRPKQWAPRDAAGVIDRWSSVEDVDFPGQDILILARNNYALTEQVIPVLRSRGILYEYRGEPGLPKGLTDAIWAWERLRGGEAVPKRDARIALAQISGAPELKGDGDDMVSMGDIPGLKTTAIWHSALDRLPVDDMSYLLAAARAGEKLTKKPRVRLSTIHSAKGAQADHVVLLTEMARRTAEEAYRSPDDEARVWYVGVTRARERLSLVRSQSKWSYPL